MPFLNTTIEIENLPAAETVSLLPLQPAYLTLLRWQWVITSFIILAVAAAAILFIPGIKEGVGWWIITLVAFLLIGFHLLFTEKSFPRQAYAIREHDVMHKKGWLIQRLRICPINRIQNCSLESGPLERRFRLASLTLYTAGSEGADMRIPGLKKEEAERLRQFILSKINDTGTTG